MTQGQQSGTSRGGDALQRALHDLGRPSVGYAVALSASAVALVVAAAITSRYRYAAQPLAYLGLAGVIVAFGVTTSAFMWRLAARRRMLALGTAIAAIEESRAQAEASNRAKTRFLATMSHEIRTPMNGVVGMIGLLQDTGLTKEQANYAKTAESSARTLLSIIDELLDTTKIEQGRVDLDMAPVDVAQLSESVVELMAPRAHAKGVDISAHVDTSVPPRVIADELRIRQILLNLCGNAVKFTEKGGISVTASYGQNMLAIEVRDTGIGMTADEAGLVFGEFVQANAETSRKYGGTGLGLAISKNLAERMGGSISVESEPGKGTLFRVTIPAEAAACTIEPARPLAGRSFEIAMPDQPSADHLVKSLVALGAGAELIDASNLAVELAETTPMPLICDASFAAELRKFQKPSRPVWVVMRAEDRRQEADLMGPPFAGYLLKPLRRSTLVKQLTASDTERLDEAVAGLRDITTAAKRGPLKILLAEDNPVNALLARIMLGKTGHDVTHAQNGRQVIDMLASGSKPDLIIMDVEMPELNGIDTTRLIRNGGAGDPDVPILALTANARREDHEACLAAGMNGHLSKPFDRQDLEEAIAKLVLRHAA